MDYATLCLQPYSSAPHWRRLYRLISIWPRTWVDRPRCTFVIASTSTRNKFFRWLTYLPDFLGFCNLYNPRSVSGSTPGYSSYCRGILFDKLASHQKTVVADQFPCLSWRLCLPGEAATTGETQQPCSHRCHRRPAEPLRVSHHLLSVAKRSWQVSSSRYSRNLNF